MGRNEVVQGSPQRCYDVLFELHYVQTHDRPLLLSWSARERPVSEVK